MLHSTLMQEWWPRINQSFVLDQHLLCTCTRHAGAYHSDVECLPYLHDAVLLNIWVGIYILLQYPGSKYPHLFRSLKLAHLPLCSPRLRRHFHQGHLTRTLARPGLSGCVRPSFASKCTTNILRATGCRIICYKIRILVTRFDRIGDLQNTMLMVVEIM